MHDAQRGSAQWKIWTAITARALCARWPLAGLVATAGILAGLLGQALVLAGLPPREPVMAPTDVADTTFLEAMRAAQLRTVDRFEVYRDFRFVDRLPESRITFQHRIVSDSGRTYKAVHYDHGNGVAVADVDGDNLEQRTLGEWRRAVRVFLCPLSGRERQQQRRHSHERRM